ncbi:hypothetical protein TNCV_5060881 [Trichonephila clavipes]|nr:hypothetical protein TNCV_5060881 [Trichonephila clavipes]
MGFRSLIHCQAKMTTPGHASFSSPNFHTTPMGGLEVWKSLTSKVKGVVNEGGRERFMTWPSPQMCPISFRLPLFRREIFFSAETSKEWSLASFSRDSPALAIRFLWQGVRLFWCNVVRETVDFEKLLGWIV